MVDNKVITEWLSSNGMGITYRQELNWGYLSNRYMVPMLVLPDSVPVIASGSLEEVRQSIYAAAVDKQLG